MSFNVGPERISESLQLKTTRLGHICLEPTIRTDDCAISGKWIMLRGIEKL